MELLAPEKCPDKRTAEIRERAVGSKDRLSHPVSQPDADWALGLVISGFFFLFQGTILLDLGPCGVFKKIYFLAKYELPRTRNPRRGESKAWAGCVLHLCGKQSTLLLFSQVFLLVWKVTRAVLINIWGCQVPVEGWREVGPRKGRWFGSQRGRTGSGPGPVWLSHLSYGSRLLTGMNVLWNIYCPV